MQIHRMVFPKFSGNWRTHGLKSVIEIRPKWYSLVISFPTRIAYLGELQRLVPSSKTWKMHRYRHPIMSLFNLPAGSILRQSVLGEWLWITIFLIRWWLPLQPLFHTCYPWLSLSTNLLIPIYSFWSCRCFIVFLVQFARTTRSGLLLPVRANRTIQSCLKSLPTCLLFATT